MGRTGADGIGGTTPEETEIKASLLPDDETPLPQADIEPIELLTNELINFAEVAADNSGATDTIINTLREEIFNTLGIVEYNPGDILADDTMRVNALIDAVQSNLPEEIIEATENLFNGAVDSPERLFQLSGFLAQTSGHVSGVSAGGSLNKLNEAELRRRDADSRALNAATASMAAAQEAAREAAVNYINSLFDNAYDAIRSSPLVQEAVSRFNALVFGEEQGSPADIAASVEQGVNAVLVQTADVAQSDPELAEEISNIQSEVELVAFARERFEESSIQDALLEYRQSYNAEHGREPTEEELEQHRQAIQPEILSRVEQAMQIPEVRDSVLATARNELERIQANHSMNSYSSSMFMQAGIAASVGDLDNIEEFNITSMYDELLQEANQRLEAAQEELDNIIHLRNDPGFNLDPALVNSMYNNAYRELQNEELNIEVIELQRQAADYFYNELSTAPDTFTYETFQNIVMSLDPALFAKSEELATRSGIDETPSSMLLDATANLTPEHQYMAVGLMSFMDELSQAKIALFEAQEWRDREIQNLEHAAEFEADTPSLGVTDDFGMIAQQDGSMLGAAMDAQRAALNSLAVLRAGRELEGEELEQAIYQEAVLQELSTRQSITEEEIDTVLSAHLGMYGENLENARADITSFLHNRGIEIEMAQVASIPTSDIDPSWNRAAYDYMEADAAVMAAEILAAGNDISVHEFNAMILGTENLSAVNDGARNLVLTIIRETDPDFTFSEETSPDQLANIHNLIENNIMASVDGGATAYSREEIFMTLANTIGLEGEELQASTEQIVANLQAEHGNTYVDAEYPPPADGEPHEPDTPEEEPQEPVVVGSVYDPAGPGGPT